MLNILNGTIFMPNNLDEYTVTVKASLSAGTIGGFGIFFDTTAETNGANDNGFIFQFDTSSSGVTSARSAKGSYSAASEMALTGM